MAALGTLTAADGGLVRSVLTTITGGQELDVRRFANAGRGKITALETAAELDDYARIAWPAVWAKFWTKLCRAHLFPDADLDEKRLIADGIRFGKGLQLVNILRDLPADLKNGRCYLPLEKLAAMALLALTPENLLLPEKEEKISAAVPGASRPGGGASGRRLALYEYAAVRAISGAAGVRVAGFIGLEDH